MGTVAIFQNKWNKAMSIKWQKHKKWIKHLNSRIL